MIKIGIIVGSTRPGRHADSVAQWVYEKARKRTDAQFEVVDIKDYNLPMLDEPVPPSQGKYSQAHTREWARKVASFDAYVFVTAEYNHAPPAALKNALDFVYAEWNNKAAGIVAYGASANGSRAAEHLRQVLGELQIADVRAQVLLNLFTDFENFAAFKPNPAHEANLATMLDQVVAWGGALKGVRVPKTATVSVADPATEKAAS
jgi:NAD(P)H-dependent FMN reductase